MDKPRDRQFGNLDEAPERGALHDHGVIVENLPRIELVLHQPELLDLQKSAFGFRRNLLPLARMLGPFRQQLRRNLRLRRILQVRRELAMERQVGITTNRRSEVRIVLLRESEMSDRRRVVDRLLHRPEDHRRQRRIERIPLDGLQELREHLRILDIAHLDAKAPQLGTEQQDLLRIRRFVQAREDLHPARPQLLRNRLVRRDHALLDHLMRLVVGTRHETRHLAVAVEDHLGLGDLQVQRPRVKPLRPQLLRELVDRKNGSSFSRSPRKSRTSSITRNQRHHLLISESRLRPDDRLRELTLDHLTVPVKRHEDREREPVLVRHERADAVTELLRKHRHDAVAEIDARRALVRLAVDGASRPHVMRNVSDMHAENAVPPAVGLEAQRIVVVARRHRIAGEDEFLPQVQALRVFRLAHQVLDPRSLVQDFPREGLRQLVELHHRRGVFAGGSPGRREQRLFEHVFHRLANLPSSAIVSA